jgi:uncharacterized cysteine cluster protein YcgN (CxxCxxCC family)
MSGHSKPFWQTKPLEAMSEIEWESLCDGCGRCCLVNYEDIDTGELVFGSVSCSYLDNATCRCMVYERRLEINPECKRITPQNVGLLTWLPETCAYRLLSRGSRLEHWHPLVSGNRQSVHRAGISIVDKVISGKYVHPDDLEHYRERRSIRAVLQTNDLKRIMACRRK